MTGSHSGTQIPARSRGIATALAAGALGLTSACGDDRGAVPDADSVPLAANAQRTADEHVCPVSPKSCVRFILIETGNEPQPLSAEAEQLERDGWTRTLRTGDRIEYESPGDVAVRVERLDRFMRDFRSTLRDGGAWKQGPQDFASRALRTEATKRPALVATLTFKAR